MKLVSRSQCARDSLAAEQGDLEIFKDTIRRLELSGNGILRTLIRNKQKFLSWREICEIGHGSDLSELKVKDTSVWNTRLIRYVSWIEWWALNVELRQRVTDALIRQRLEKVKLGKKGSLLANRLINLFLKGEWSSRGVTCEVNELLYNRGGGSCQRRNYARR